MPSHCFQPMPHGIHLVLGFDLALYSRSEDFHLLDCVHAAHTKKTPYLKYRVNSIFNLKIIRRQTERHHQQSEHQRESYSQPGLKFHSHLKYW